jgi:hypothetical protein
MRFPSVRFNLRQSLFALVVVGLLLAGITRHQRLKTMVVNQEITLLSAEANVLNAAIARESAELAFMKCLKIGENGLESALSAIAGDRGSDEQNLNTLRSSLLQARAVRREKRAIWEHERRLLKRLKWELVNSWRLWRSIDGADDGLSQSPWRLTAEEKAELDERLRHFGYAIRE